MSPDPVSEAPLSPGPPPPTFASIPVPAPFDTGGYPGIPLTVFTWRFWMVAGVLGTQALSILALSFALTRGPLGPIASDLARFALSTLPYMISVGAAWLVVLGRGATLPTGLGLRRFVWTSGLLAAALGAIVARVASVQISSLMFRVGIDTSRATDQFAGWGETATARLALVVIALVIAPIAEEVLFRGVLLTWLRDRWGAVAGVLVSSALFAAVHMDPILFPALFVVGVILARLYTSSRSLWVPIICHSLFNLSGVALYLLLSNAGMV